MEFSSPWIPLVLMLLMAFAAWGPGISVKARPEKPDPKQRRSWIKSRTRRSK